MAAAGRLARRRRCTWRQGLPLSQRHAIRTQVMWWSAATMASLLSWHVLRSRGRMTRLGDDMH